MLPSLAAKMLATREQPYGVRPITASWPIADIIYVAFVAPVMLMALLEWWLLLLGFLYCFWKVYWKADENKWTVRIMAIVQATWLICIRLIFLAVMMVTLPLPPQVVQYFPPRMVSILQWFAFYTFAGLLVGPWLLCVFHLTTHYVGRKKRTRAVLDAYAAPKVVIVLPCFNEKPEVLLRTVNSIADAEYPPSCMHIFLSFDGEQEDELFLSTIEKLGVPITLDVYPRSIDIAYRGLRVTVSRFKWGGKRHCQKKTFNLIDKVYEEYLRKHDNLFMLFIDSDCILDKACIANFMYDMELKPGGNRDMLAMTGVITATGEISWKDLTKSCLTILQDMEYVHGQLYERSVETACGAVTCLPGALTMLRVSAFRQLAKFYFADKADQCDDMFDYAKGSLGEDRYLTHLFMVAAEKGYQLGMCTSAFCKTDAVETYKSLLSQRRRWFLGFITNEVCMLTDTRLWRRYPVLLIIRLAQSTIRTTALLFFIMVISLITTSQKVANLPFGFIAVSLGLNWLLMFFFAARLGRLKMLLYPVMFVVNPFANWVYMVYGCLTCARRTWGGPRVDAIKADEKITPEQAVAEAKGKGDELNIVPETFKDVAPLGRKKSVRTAPLLPSSKLEGRFALPEQTNGGYYAQRNDSIELHPDQTSILDDEQVYYHQGPRRGSMAASSYFGSHESFAMPRRVESVWDLQNILQYHAQQREQAPAGGAYFEAPQDHVGQDVPLPDYRNPRPELSHRPADVHREPEGKVPQFSNGPLPQRRDRSVDSARSAESDESVPMHFSVPRRGSSEFPRRPQSPPQFAPRVHMPSRPTDIASGDTLTVPSASFHPSTRFTPAGETSAARTGRSPLARKSFTRLATDDAPSTAGTRTEVEVRQPTRPSTDEERRGRRRRRTSVGADGRRRLSKAHRSSRSSSRA
ncbi:Chitin synthase D [Fulvia fulva]|nr:Chitin synthase D [Fulvia fulva]WPV25454.1 Chitin synthase D [Fulvia fulva]